MAVVQQYKLADGSTVSFEVEDTTGTTLAQPGERRMVSDEGGGVQSFENALEKVKSAANSMLASMSALATAPDTVELQFGLKFAAGVGVLFTKASTEGNFSVKLTWSKKKG